MTVKNKNLRSEKDILSSWNNVKNIIVSIVCTAYNHEDYIESALFGFLMQETDFAFEILINDDASKDKTPAILLHYQDLYPQIVKPILQSENQYSQGIKPMQSLYKKAKGKYIALCEGDDYWNDKHKLQKQVAVFTENKKISLCFHPAIELDHVANRENIMCQHYPNSGPVKTADVILGRGPFMPTASLMFINQDIETLTKSYESAPIGDYFVQIFMSSLGEAYYLNDVMSVYRRNAVGSWTTTSHKQLTDQISHKQSMITAIDKFSYFLANDKHNKHLKKIMLFYAIDSLKITKGLSDFFFALKQLTKVSNDLSIYNRHILLTQAFFGGIIKKATQLTKKIIKKVLKHESPSS
ncbi:MAG: glycosyltransferase involved in cell wall biosynthesis [Psychromonas sp.]|jgi:glycosyltransferase involved in cell wall biosynthesis|uniref:glycosyltransferase family 2 protein n=1 Tax=Psychromonas sp. TaxID=1884585 RepID=UPI0039E404B2